MASALLGNPTGTSVDGPLNLVFGSNDTQTPIPTLPLYKYTKLTIQTMTAPYEDTELGRNEPDS